MTAMSAPSPLFDPVLARGAAAEAVSDRAWIAAMLDVEAGLAGASAEVGAIPAEQAAVIARSCRADDLDPARLGAEAAAGGNPVIPLVAALREAVATTSEDAAAAVHRGATSQDVLDTAVMLVTRDAVRAVTSDLRRAADAAAALAARHRDTPAAGRTLLQQAAPITVGLRAAGWMQGLDDAVDLLASWRATLQLGGAVGTLAAFDGRGRAVRAALARRLDLVEPVLAWHTERGRVAEIAGLYARVGTAVAATATDLVLLAQTEVGEVREDVPGRGGSSTLPHKRNPVAAVAARAAAIAVPGLVAGLLGAAGGHEYERAAGAWHAEWAPLSALARTAGSGAAWIADALEHLTVDTDAVAAGLGVTGGLLLAEHATTALRPHLGPRSRTVVTAAAARARDEGRLLADVLAEDLGDDVARTEIDAALDPAGALGESAALVDDALARRAARHAGEETS